VTEFVCEVDEQYRSVCRGLPFYAEHEGKRYCILHFPGERHRSYPRTVLERKLMNRDYDFGGIVFPEGASDFARFEFDAAVNFSGAVFKGVTDFSMVLFEGAASFRHASFDGIAVFFGTAFNELADFFRATFTEEVDFSESVFRTFVYFRQTTFKQQVRFSGLHTFNHQAAVSFISARIDRPEQFSFDRVALRPSWFIGVEVRKVAFTNVWWHGLLRGSEGGLNDEIEYLQRSGVDSPHPLLTRTCRELSTNAGEKREDPIASESNYWANDVLRKEYWMRHRLNPRLSLYWILNGYGERPFRAFGVLTLMTLVFAFLYMLAGPPEMRALPMTGSTLRVLCIL
jgi:hypothetical protein